jgi:hemerythrin
MEFLSSWLSHHIKGSDQKLASFISRPPLH